VILEEFLFTEENCIVRDEDDNHFTNEIIIPISTAVQHANGAKIKAQPIKEVKRIFHPNSQWQYFKVYCGRMTAEKILRNTILPFVEDGLEKGLFDYFFFLRYGDDSGHLRIRFYNADASKQPDLQTSFLNCLRPLLEAGYIDKVIIDTYKRELERYTPELIDEAEQLFYSDSLAVLKLLRLLSEVVESDQYRMLFALRGIDMFLGDFGYGPDQKLQFSRSLQKSFFAEFGGHPQLTRQLNSKYRSYQSRIFSHLNPGDDTENGIDEAVEILRQRSAMNTPICETITRTLGIEDEGQLSSLLNSYIHMFVNRIFIVQQRKYELVIYHFLERYYTSLQAIQKKKLSYTDTTKSIN
ncbi:MAG: hypothetical protein EOP48_09430, partial [Sphingobacteriales bacterium]